jgi:RNA recognition motif-containing protein
LYEPDAANRRFALNRLYVGNLPYRTTEEELREAFEAHGEVVDVNIIKDRMSGVSKGFGFVEFGTDAEAKAAMEALNGTQFGGRTLRVDEARPRNDGGGRR